MQASSRLIRIYIVQNRIIDPRRCFPDCQVNDRRIAEDRDLLTCITRVTEVIRAPSNPRFLESTYLNLNNITTRKQVVCGNFGRTDASASRGRKGWKSENLKMSKHSKILA